MSKNEKIMHFISLRSLVRKWVAILFCIVIVVSVLVLPVSALNSGGLEILGTSGYIWQPIEGKYYYATILNNENDIVFNYQWNSFNGVVQTEVVLSVTGSSYGRLSLSYQSAFGNTSPISSFEGLYDGTTGEKLVDGSVGHNYYAMGYEGKIPSTLIVRGHFTCSSPDVIQSYTILNVSFTNLENEQIIKNQDKNTEEIKANQDKNTEEIKANQDKNTQSIIDNQNQLQENEKNEAETEGQGSVDDISGAIEDKSAGFISSITSLVSSMSYEGTVCAWTFPALKLPSIEGVMPEYQLTDEKPIDFEFWVNKIPSNILLLVRSLLTIALIGYCFKELYSTISYVLTLKGGGNNE